MNLRLMRRGEWLALAGAVGLLVVLFLPWFGLELDVEGTGLRLSGAEQSGWESLGWVMDVLMVVLIAGGVMVAATTALRWAPAWYVGAGVVTAGIGVLIVLVLLGRILFQPDLGIDAPNRFVDTKAWAWVGLVLAACIPAGAWLALDDERTDAPESRYEPPPPRPVPGGPASAS